MQRPEELQVIFGGQWGSEGKGRICAHLANHRRTPWLYAIRVGGPNAGHTIQDINGKELKLQQIPCAAFVSQQTYPIIGPAGLIEPDVLERELNWLGQTWGVESPLLIVDAYATVITEQHQHAEKVIGTGTTGEGVGAATAEKVMRQAVRFVDYLNDLPKKERSWWMERVVIDNTQRLVTQSPHTSLGLTVQIEGTQGYLLSLNAGRYYPYCTSRDCGPEAIAGACGLNLRLAKLNRIICVMRTYPIRIAGNSGPMGEELSWDEMVRITDGYITTPEMTTVTKKIRRIAKWDNEIARRVALETAPTEIAITFADYTYPHLNTLWTKYGKTRMEQQTFATDDTQATTTMTSLDRLIEGVEDQMKTTVSMISVGPGQILDRWTPQRTWGYWSDKQNDAPDIFAREGDTVRVTSSPAVASPTNAEVDEVARQAAALHRRNMGDQP